MTGAALPDPSGAKTFRLGHLRAAPRVFARSPRTPGRPMFRMGRREGPGTLHPAVTAEVIEGYLKGSRPEPGEAAYEGLTDRERVVLKLIAEGRTSKEIAQVLEISLKTVITHRTNLMQKLGLHNKAELVKYAVRLGLVQLEPEPRGPPAEGG